MSCNHAVITMRSRCINRMLPPYATITMLPRCSMQWLLPLSPGRLGRGNAVMAARHPTSPTADGTGDKPHFDTSIQILSDGYPPVDERQRLLEARGNYHGAMPAEINRQAVVRYLKKDVRKTQLYRSLPVYLFVLLLVSLVVSLQRLDDPQSYWGTQAGKNSMLGNRQATGEHEFNEVASADTFWSWLEARLHEDIAGAHVAAQSSSTASLSPEQTPDTVLSFLVLRQFRSPLLPCDNTETKALSPNLRAGMAKHCLKPYSDDSASVAPFGPVGSTGVPIYRSNKDMRKAGYPVLDTVTISAIAHSYNTPDKAFTALLPLGSASDSTTTHLAAQLHVKKANAVMAEDYLTAAKIMDELAALGSPQASLQRGKECLTGTAANCTSLPGCLWTRSCVSAKVACSEMDYGNCTGTPQCKWDDATACTATCSSIPDQDQCEVSGCAWNGTCNDGLPRSVALLSSLRNHDWVDWQTRAVMVEKLTYNAHTRHFLFTSFVIEILAAGMWIPQVRAFPFNVLSLESARLRAVFVFDIIITIYIAWSLVATFLQWRHNVEVGKVESVKEVVKNQQTNDEPEPTSPRCSAARRWINAIDFAVFFEFCFTVIFASAYVFRWQMWHYGIAMVRGDQFDGLSPEEADLRMWSDLLHYVGLGRIEGVLYATAVILCWLRLFEYVQYNERLNSLTETISVAMGSLISLMIIFCVIFCGFTFAGNLVYGADLRSFSTLLQTAGYMMRLLFSAEIDNYNQFREVQEWWSIIYFGLFFALAWLVLLNMVLAIIAGSFNTVKENSANGGIPSWNLTSLATDVKKFFRRLKTRGQPFAFSAHSLRTQPIHRSSTDNGNTFDIVKGNYVVDRIRAIQILTEKDRQQDGSSTDSTDEYITLKQLEERLRHLHPDDIHRIFTKATNEGDGFAGSRTMKLGERFAFHLTQRISILEKSLGRLAEQVSDQESMLKKNAVALMDMHDGTNTVQEKVTTIESEVGTGVIQEVHRALVDMETYTLPTINQNVCSVPPEVVKKLRSLLNRRVGGLKKRIARVEGNTLPIEDIRSDMDDIAEMLALATSPHATMNGGGFQELSVRGRP
eukprot:Sspe_Gene.12957::Locus_4439_Transcript_1_1_Confidence_1.000_Length_5686::g.12957::m.12957